MLHATSKIHMYVTDIWKYRPRKLTLSEKKPAESDETFI